MRETPRGKEKKNVGEPAFLQKRSSADSDNKPQARSTLINGEASPAQFGPTPSGPHPLRQKTPRWLEVDHRIVQPIGRRFIRDAARRDCRSPIFSFPASVRCGGRIPHRVVHERKIVLMEPRTGGSTATVVANPRKRAVASPRGATNFCKGDFLGAVAAPLDRRLSAPARPIVTWGITAVTAVTSRVAVTAVSAIWAISAISAI